MIIRAEANVGSLAPLAGHRHWRAERGQHGEGNLKTGRSGKDMIVRVPAGRLACRVGRRRQFTVCGEHGTFDLRPLGGNTFRLALERAHKKYKTGYQDITVAKGPGIFISAFRDMAAVLREEKDDDYGLDHELAVHEAVLRASGYPVP